MDKKNCKAPERSLGGLFAMLRKAYFEWRDGIPVAADTGIGADKGVCRCLTAYSDGRIEWHDDALRERLCREMLADDCRMSGKSTIPAAIFRHRKAWVMNG